MLEEEGCCGFWKYHFGTDMQIASWMFLISSALFIAMEVDEILDAERGIDDPDIYIKVEDWCFLVMGILFTLGSIYFVILSYPAEMAAEMNKIAHEDMSKLTFLERYFTGTDFLIATWLFLLCGLPLFGYTGYMLADDPSSCSGWVLLLGSLGYVAILSVWVIASMPENLVANDGKGSSYFFDYCFQPYCFPLFCCYGVCCRCCCNSMDLALWRVHLGTDMLAGGWLFFLMACLLMPYAIYYAIWFPGETYTWLTMGSTVGFVWGAGLMVYTSYPENVGSTWTWDTMTCNKASKLAMP